ncbi:hypothetical protein V8E55_011684 [Tylopilus felleus]
MMFTSWLFIAAVFAAVYIHPASSFQPGPDYGVYETSNLYNWRVPVSNVTVSNAADTLPQIEPCTGRGWEQWSLFLHGTFPMLLRWTRGDPSSGAPAPAQFDVLIADVNRTTVQGKVVGDLAYTNGGRMSYYSVVGGTSSASFDSVVKRGAIAGVVHGIHECGRGPLTQS